MLFGILDELDLPVLIKIISLLINCSSFGFLKEVEVDQKIQELECDLIRYKSPRQFFTFSQFRYNELHAILIKPKNTLGMAVRFMS